MSISPNPYHPVRAEDTASIEARSPIPWTLCLTPWRIRSVGASCSRQSALWLGGIALTIQIGLRFANALGSVGEPYRDLQHCVQETVATWPISLIFGVAGGIFISSMVSVIPGRVSRTLLLIPWASMLFYLPWLFFNFCRTLDDASYGIINDDRPMYMKETFIVVLGSDIAWLVLICLSILAVLISPSKQTSDSHPN